MNEKGAGIAVSVKRRAESWAARLRISVGAKDSSQHHTCSGAAYPLSWLVKKRLQMKPYERLCSSGS
jgi:hypothetical protein